MLVGSVSVVDFSEIRDALGAWEGQDVTFGSSRGAEVLHEPVSGRLYRRREMEGSPDLAMFCLQEPATGAVDSPALTIVDFVIGPEARGEMVGGALVIYQGDARMEVRLA